MGGEAVGLEQWRPVAQYEGLYEVSDHGRVRSVDRVDTAGKFRRGTMKRSRRQNGYDAVDLWKANVSRTARAHVLVLEAFVGRRPDGADGCHNDGDRLNNHVSNLRWDSRAANIDDAVRHRTHFQSRKTHCPQGHPYLDWNLSGSGLRKGRRWCKACLRAKSHAEHRGIGFDPKVADIKFAEMVEAQGGYLTGQR